MTPDHWRQAMENEAASVPDPVWAADVRRHLQKLTGQRVFRFCVWAALVLLALSLLTLGGVVALSRYAWNMDDNPVGGWLMVNTIRFDVALLGLLVIAGAFLGRVGLKPIPTALALAMLPLMQWALGKAVYIPAEWGEMVRLQTVNGIPTLDLPTVVGVPTIGLPTVDFAEFPLSPGKWIMALGCAGCGLLGAWLVQRLRRITG